MNAPQRQIARITFERRHAPQNPLWNARPRSTAKENCGVSGWKEEWEAFRFKKKPCKAARRGRKIDKQPRDIDGAEFDSFLTNYFASLFLSPSFFFIVFSRLSRFCLLFYFLLYFFFFFFVFFSDLGLVGRSIGVGPFLPVRNYNCNYRGFECRSLRELDFFCVFK